MPQGAHSWASQLVIALRHSGQQNTAISHRSEKFHHGIQILIVWSLLPVATTLTSFSGSVASLPVPEVPFTALVLAPEAGLRPQAIVVTKWLCASTIFIHRPVESSQTRIVLSSEADSKYFPEGWNASARIQLSCPAYHASLA